MLREMKNKIKQQMIQKAYAKYKAEEIRQQKPYLQWILKNETANKHKAKKCKEETISMVSYESCTTGFSLALVSGDYVIFSSEKGSVSAFAVEKIVQIFETQKMVSVLYGDEDYLNKEGVRCEPWFKPDWSPDTLLGSFYFGGLFAIRRQMFLDISWRNEKDCMQNIYDFVLQATEKVAPTGIYHLSHILFHNDMEFQEAELHANQILGADSFFEQVKKDALQRRGTVGVVVYEETVQTNAIIYDTATNPLVSIIIPSKDNPDVLEVCLSSIRKKTRYENYEIIVVDNGSNQENRKNIEQMSKLFDVQYKYEMQTFNFSKMCNFGVSFAKGEYLLLLNDDCEVIQEEWLGTMLGQAMLPHVGAVGVKLLYPKNRWIQHVGVTNLGVGPAHKLAELPDDCIYYHGQNKLMYDMIAVTAACLMIAKSKYEMVNGFCEALEVSYNDVDFCFSLYEKGFYNVQRNDVCLLHHESLSRGNDELSETKWKRLLEEKDKLYQRHPTLYRYDPFYSKHLVENAKEYICNYRYDYEMTTCFSVLTKSKKKSDMLEPYVNGCLVVTTEHAGIERKLETKEPDIYLIEGWNYILGMDNCHFKRLLVFSNEQGEVWTTPIFERYRKDVVAILPEEKNVALAGFVCRIRQGELPMGTYQLGMLAKDSCSRQKLYAKLDMTLEMK